MHTTAPYSTVQLLLQPPVMGGRVAIVASLASSKDPVAALICTDLRLVGIASKAVFQSTCVRAAIQAVRVAVIAGLACGFYAVAAKRRDDLNRPKLAPSCVVLGLEVEFKGLCISYAIFQKGYDRSRSRHGSPFYLRRLPRIIPRVGTSLRLSGIQLSALQCCNQTNRCLNQTDILNWVLQVFFRADICLTKPTLWCDYNENYGLPGSITQVVQEW